MIVYEESIFIMILHGGKRRFTPVKVIDVTRSAVFPSQKR
jgi:hypothetical protein